jgi:3-hydroxybutyryl-CoA dehydratase
MRVYTPAVPAAAQQLPITKEMGMSGESLNGFYFEDLSVGQSAIFAKTVTETDVVTFAGVSGDFNPVHINEEFAKNTPFKGRIAHGMLSAAFISTVFGTKLPGPGCIYVSQTLKFKAPVRIGDTVVARVEVTALVPEKKFATFKTTCSVGEKVVLDGEATLMVPSKG